jgi:hypothetical protein
MAPAQFQPAPPRRVLTRKGLRLFSAAQRHAQTDHGSDAAADEHPDSLVRGVDANDDKHNSANEQGKRGNFIHNRLSISIDSWQGSNDQHSPVTTLACGRK